MKRFTSLIFAILLSVCFLSGSATAIHLGMVSGSSSSSVNWSGWDATTEAGIASANIFAVIGSGGNNADEVGLNGSLSVANCTWSQVGSIAGTGTYRTLTGANQWFTVTTGFRDFMAGAAQWGIMFKVENWSPTKDYESIIRWGAGSDVLLRRKLQTVLYGSAQGAAVETADTPATSGVLFVYIGCNGSDFRIGFQEGTGGSGAGGQPAKWSDFTATKRAASGSTVTLTTMNEATPVIFDDAQALSSREATLRFYWAVFCNNDSLIDFNS